MSLYLCDPAKNKSCKKTACYGNGGPCFMTTNESLSAGGAELSENEIEAIDRFYSMRIKYEQKKMKKKLRREARLARRLHRRFWRRQNGGSEQ